MSPQDITNRQKIVTELTMPVQDSLSVLKISAQYGAPRYSGKLQGQRTAEHSVPLVAASNTEQP